MKLSERSKHGLRAMVELALNYGQGPMKIKTIAERAGICGKYIEQMVAPLKVSGLVRTIRGFKGGYVLAMPPGEINLGMIVNAIEQPDEPTGCAKHKKFSKRCCGCVMATVWARLEKNASGYLDSTTLQDLLDMEN